MSNTVIFVAVSKETGSVFSGVNGQHAYGDMGTLRKSMSHSLSWIARSKGVKPAELYDIYEIDIATIIPNKVYK